MSDQTPFEGVVNVAREAIDKYEQAVKDKDILVRRMNVLLEGYKTVASHAYLTNDTCLQIIVSSCLEDTLLIK